MTTHTNNTGKESTLDKIKDKLHIGHSDSSTTGTTHTTGTTSHTTPTTHTTGTAEGVAGPHSSRVANAADPRIDSDLDGSNRVGQNTTSTGYGTTGTTHSTGTTHTTGTAEGIHGPHSSRAANAADPRVDSDLDGNRIPNTTSSGYGTADHTGFGSTGTAGHPGHHQGTTHGNHLGGTGDAGGISHSTNAGPHDSNLANKADPRVDSDLSSTGNRHGAHTGGVFGTSGSHATPGSGTAQNTAGPHNSDMLNKADPRVDADLDNSTTIGGNKTYA